MCPAFTLGQVSPTIEALKSNALFMGGDAGSDTAIMLHPYLFDDSSKYIGMNASDICEHVFIVDFSNMMACREWYLSGWIAKGR